MLRFKHSLYSLALGALGLAGSALGSSLTSNNAANVVAWTQGPDPSVYLSWEGTLSSAVNDNISFAGLPSCNDPVNGCSVTILNNGAFPVVGSNGATGSGVLTSSQYPLTITMLNTPLLTGLEFDLTGNMIVSLTLSDGSTVTTGAQSYSSPTFVTFDSPLQITSANFVSTSSGTLYDLSWGTVNPADLPTQPVIGGGGTGGTGGTDTTTSDTPEGATFLLMGGGLLFMSRWAKRHSLSF